MARPLVCSFLSCLLLCAETVNTNLDGGEDATRNEGGGAQARIAIIGGALSGSLTAKYVAEWDASCLVSSVAVFEALPIQSPVAAVGSGYLSSSNGKDEEKELQQEQGTRVQTVRIMSVENENENEGALVEVGASIGYREFHLILDHIRSDPDHLKVVPPFSTGTKPDDGDAPKHHLPLYQGLGIYDGRATSAADAEGDPDSPSRQAVWSLNTAPIFACEWIPAAWRGFVSNLAVAWRYGWELRKLTLVTKKFLKKFAAVPALLDDPLSHFFESPADLWKHLEMDGLVAAPFDDVLETLGVPLEVPAWRSSYLGHGSVRREFVEAMNLVNYNQDNRQVNAMVGFGSFAAAFGGLFAVEGGNVQLIASAYRQANGRRRRWCGAAASSSSQAEVQQVPQRVTTVIATTSNDDNGAPVTKFELFAKEQSLGVFDIVVVAAPLQQARVDFYIQSAFDTSVLQPMPLGHRGVVDPERILEDGVELDRHQGHPPFPPDLDPASTRPYTQVVTTLVSNATLALLPAHQRPRSIMMTARGKASLHNITAITQLQHKRYRGAGNDGDNGTSVSLYKVFSDDTLSREVLAELFGPYHVLEHVKVWPRPYGGATPDYQGGTTSERFVLYDASSTGIAQGSGRGGGAIYYPVAMEQSTLACMELAAIGAKATAKLIARRLGLLQSTPYSRDTSNDEL